MNKKKLFKIVISILIAGAILYILFKQINIREMFYLIFRANPIYIVYALIASLLIFLNRAYRFQFFLKEKVPIKDLLNVTFIHNFYLNLMPFRTGELALILQLKKKGIDYTEGISSLSIVRIFDFFSYVIFIFIFSFLLKDVPIFISNSLKLIAGIMLFSIFWFVILILFGSKIIKPIKKFIKSKIPIKILLIIIDKIEEIIKDFNRLKSTILLVKIIITSLMNVFFVILFSYLILLSLDLGISILILGLAQMAVVLFSIVPIQGFAAFGTTEGVWALTMMSLGIGKEVAILSGFYVHIVSLLFVILFGAYAYIAEGIKK